METIATASSRAEKAPRQAKSKHKSRSGCQSCKLRRLKCDETKPDCNNCRKKGISCPGYALRLTWSTKYERPRAPTRPEPSNFDQLVSAVTQSIVPGIHGSAPSSPSVFSSEPTTPPFFRDAVPAADDAGPIRPKQFMRQGQPTIGVSSQRPAVTSVPTIARFSPSPTSLSKAAACASYTTEPEVVGFLGFDADPYSIAGTPASMSDDSYWANSRSNSPGLFSGIENMATLATSADVEEPETPVSTSESEPAPSVRQTKQAVLGIGHIIAPTPQMARQPVDIPSFLIQHWFKSVCGGWCAYDSPANPYRQLSASLWQSSMAVFYALQSMAAASLVEHLPHLKEVARVAPRLAFQAITFEFQSFRATSAAPTAFPGGLVLSLFCMSSSICWTDSRQFGLQFLKPGRAILNCLNKHASSLSPGDRELLDFFNGCLVYEEMLRSIVSNDESDLENLASWQASSAQSVSVLPHAWTGVSPDLLRLFGKTMVLCRRARNRWRQSHDTVEEKMFKESLDHQEAVVIEQVLLAIELPDLPHDITDEDTPASDRAELKRNLHDAADAYRLSSLLQLYQTFPDLIARRLPLQMSNGFLPYSGWLSPLALHITAILRRIPPSSSMRCLQPLLCLCAGTGLRYDNIDPSLQIQTQGNDPFGVSVGQHGALAPDVGPVNPTQSVFGFPPISTCVFGENELEIADARRFLMERLGRLEQNLPPKPIQVEKRLLKSIWSTYDSETQMDCKTHWLDVMVNNGLESVFG